MKLHSQFKKAKENTRPLEHKKIPSTHGPSKSWMLYVQRYYSSSIWIIFFSVHFFEWDIQNCYIPLQNNYNYKVHYVQHWLPTKSKSLTIVHRFICKSSLPSLHFTRTSPLRSIFLHFESPFQLCKYDHS